MGSFNVSPKHEMKLAHFHCMQGCRELEDHDLFPEDQDQLGDLDLKKVIRSLKVILIFDLGKIALIFWNLEIIMNLGQTSIHSVSKESWVEFS